MAVTFDLMHTTIAHFRCMHNPFSLFEWVGLACETKYVNTCSASMVVHGMIHVHATKFLLAQELYIIINQIACLCKLKLCGMCMYMHVVCTCTCTCICTCTCYCICTRTRVHISTSV